MKLPRFPMVRLVDSPVLYRCGRCGAESCDPRDAERGYCPICGCLADELAGVEDAAAALRDPVTGVHRLPVA